MAVEESDLKASQDAENMPVVLRRLKGYYGFFDHDIAAETGLKRSLVQLRMHRAGGDVRAWLVLADFFGVSLDKLRWEPEDVLAWTATHRPDCPAARLAANLRSGSFVQEALALAS